MIQTNARGIRVLKNDQLKLLVILYLLLGGDGPAANLPEDKAEDHHEERWEVEWRRRADHSNMRTGRSVKAARCGQDKKINTACGLWPMFGPLGPRGPRERPRLEK